MPIFDGISTVTLKKRFDPPRSTQTAASRAISPKHGKSRPKHPPPLGPVPTRLGVDVVVNSVATAFGASGAVPKIENVVYPKTKREIRAFITRHNSGRSAESPSTEDSVSQSPEGVKAGASEVAVMSDHAKNVKLVSEFICAEAVKKPGWGDSKPEHFLKGAEKLVDAIEKRDVVWLRSICNGLNVGSLKAFSEITGIKALSKNNFYTSSHHDLANSDP